MRSWNRIAKRMVLGLLVVAGCGENENDIVTRPADVAVIANVTTATAAIFFAAADPFVPAVTNGALITPEQAAAIAATSANNYYLNNCATAAASGASVNYQLNNCRGPLGIIGISGNYTVTYATATNGGVQITITSSNVTVGGVSATVNATATYNQTGAERTLTFTDRSTANSNNVAWVLNRNGTLAWTQGQTCATENSRGTLTANGNAVQMTVTNVVRCANQCTASGSQVLVTSDGTAGTVTFSGTSNPTLTVTTGAGSQTISLACSPATTSGGGGVTATGGAVRMPNF